MILFPGCITPKPQQPDAPNAASVTESSITDPVASGAGATPMKPKMSPLKPAENSQGESIPQLLRRRESELAAEKAKTAKLEAEVAKANSRIDDFLKAIHTSQVEIESVKTERDGALRKLRERDEMLVALALGKAEAERDALEGKIRYEVALTSAAHAGVLLDPSSGRPIPGNSRENAAPASRPATEEPSVKPAQGEPAAHGSDKLGEK